MADRNLTEVLINEDAQTIRDLLLVTTGNTDVDPNTTLDIPHFLTTHSNCPGSGEWFIDNVKSGTTDDVRQIAVKNDTETEMYVRTYTAGVMGEWEELMQPVRFQVYSQTWWDIPDKIAAANTTELVREFDYTPYAGSKTKQLLFSGAVTVQSEGGSDVGGQVYIEVNGTPINTKKKFTIDRWDGDVSSGNIRLPIPITGYYTIPNNTSFPLSIKIYVEAANSEFRIINGQGKLIITERGA